MPMEEVDARHFQLTVSFTHFQDMFNMKEFLFAKGSKELLPKIHELIEKNQDLEFKNSLNEATRYFVESFETPYVNIKTCKKNSNKIQPKLILEYSSEKCPYADTIKLVLAHKMYGLPFYDKFLQELQS